LINETEGAINKLYKLYSTKGHQHNAEIYLVKYKNMKNKPFYIRTSSSTHPIKSRIFL